jgi:hypothetical protein
MKNTCANRSLEPGVGFSSTLPLERQTLGLEQFTSLPAAARPRQAQPADRVRTATTGIEQAFEQLSGPALATRIVCRFVQVAKAGTEGQGLPRVQARTFASA